MPPESGSAYLDSQRQVDAICLHCYHGPHNKIYVCWIEKTQGAGGGAVYVVLTGLGRAENTMAQAQNEKGRWTSVAAARRQAHTLASQKKRRGYMDVTAPEYRGGYSFEELLTKVTVYCLHGREASPPLTPSPSVSPPPSPPAPRPITPTPYRARRKLDS